jgi:hypothetical protein
MIVLLDAMLDKSSVNNGLKAARSSSGISNNMILTEVKKREDLL